jgi:hypothetical protein
MLRSDDSAVTCLQISCGESNQACTHPSHTLQQISSITDSERNSLLLPQVCGIYQNSFNYHLLLYKPTKGRNDHVN